MEEVLYLLSLSCHFWICISFENNAGKEFLLAFPETEPRRAHSPGENIELLLAAVNQSTVEVSMSAPGSTVSIDTTLILNYGVTGYAFVNPDMRLKGSTIEKKALLVKANDSITVLCFNTEDKSSDAYLGIPIESLGTEYYIVTWEGGVAEFLVVAYMDLTTVSVTLSISGTGSVDINGTYYRNSDIILLNLNKFDSWQCQSDSDLSGTFIRSNARLAVFSGNIKVRIESSSETVGSRDHLVEMLVPVDRWGKHFIVTSTPKCLKRDIIKIISSINRTSVTIKGDVNTTSYIEEAGQFKVSFLDPSSAVEILSDKPVMVTQFTATRLNRTDDTDPSMLYIVPVEQYGSSYSFSVISHTFTSYLVLTVKQDSRDELFLDDAGLFVSNFRQVGSSEFVTGYVQISQGFHQLTILDKSKVFGAWLFGAVILSSYMVPLGMRLDRINEVVIDEYSETTTAECGCPEISAYNVTHDAEGVQKKIEELKEILTVEKSTLSSMRRSKTSATDKRSSSAVIGSVLGIGILSVVGALVIIPDIPAIVRDLMGKD